MRYNYISIEGNIGVGKSTLAKMLSKTWETELMLESFEDNPYLAKFYQNEEEFAFQLEMSFLAERYSQQKKTFQSLDLFRSRVIADYMMPKCFVFSATNLSEEEFMIYRNFYRVIEGQVPSPELIVYLHRSVPILKDQIKQRGRKIEEAISDTYLNKIEAAYFEVFKQMEGQKILLLDLQSKDFENDPVVYKSVHELINTEHKSGIHRYKV